MKLLLPLNIIKVLAILLLLIVLYNHLQGQ
jgi:hypothetical protein